MRAGTTGMEEVDLGLKGRVAIVTGSSKGIGKSMGLELAGEGAKVAICAKDELQLIRTAREMESVTRSKVLPVHADLTRQEDIERLIGSSCRISSGPGCLASPRPSPTSWRPTGFW